jgi:hypothetical protein
LAAGDFIVMLQVTTKVRSLRKQMYMEYFFFIFTHTDDILAIRSTSVST